MGRRQITRRHFKILEQLESRTLLSQVNVQSFGASPNDGRDDRTAIINAINASSAGDTIFFPAGTYNLSDQVYLKGSRNYLGQDGTVIVGASGNHIFHIQEDNIRVEGFTLNGKPIMIDRNNGVTINNLVINNNTLICNASGDNTNGITFTTPLANSSFTNNTFQLNASMGIYGYYWNNLTIANNEFLNGLQGMHLDNLNDAGQNLLIEQNYFSGIKRMGVEYQGGGHNTTVQDNWFENPSLSSNFNDNNESFAFSIVADRSSGTLAQRNVILENGRPDGVGVRIGFETGGDGTVVQNNYISGINQVLANTDGTGTTSCLAQNNYYNNVLDGLVGRGLTQNNNGPQVNLQWLIDRGHAGRNRRFNDPSNPGGSVSNSQGSTPQPPSSPGTINVPASAGATYLSDLNWTSMTNGWGSAEKDHSNGEMGSNDGHTITLNGQTYAKGLGVHASSDISYNLNGQYAQFNTDIGVDDEVGSNGSVVFQVYLDGAKVYDSGTMSGTSTTKSVTLDVTGKSTLRLVVATATNGNSYDHADWANASLSTSGSTPPADTGSGSTGGTGSWLSDLTWTSATNGWGAVEKNRSNGEMGSADGRTITLNGQTYAKGLGVHATSDISYAINGQYTQFSTDIGLDDEVGSNGSVVFQVFLDGTKVYDSGTMTGSSATKSVTLDVTGKSTLRLVVAPATNGNAYDHADWAGAKLTA